MILTVRTDQLTLQTTNETLPRIVSATAMATGSMTTAGPAWQSFVGDLQRRQEAPTWATLCQCLQRMLYAVRATCYVVCRLSLSLVSKNHQRTIEQKAEYFIYEQEVGQ